jgi:peptide/nickel transport system permease protein
LIHGLGITDMALGYDVSDRNWDLTKSKSQLQVVWEQFRKHQLAVFGGAVLAMLYMGAIFAPFISPYSLSEYSTSDITKFHPPTRVYVIDPENGQLNLPFVYKSKRFTNPETFAEGYTEDRTIKFPIKLFHNRSESPFKLFGIIPMTLHLFGVDAPGNVFILGTDGFGRDNFTRIWYGAQISLTIGIFAVLISTVVGLFLGGLAGFYGGWIDNIIMRFVEILSAIPGLFLLLALSALIPRNIDPILSFYGIILALGGIGWGGLARTVRSQISALREVDFVQAAIALGASEMRIIAKHMLPVTFSLLIVGLSIGIPGAILTESGLSFLGFGIREPYSSWGLMISVAQEGGFASIEYRPWVLIPGFFIVLAVLCWNFLGDGLRDAVDPRKRQ